MLFKFVKYERCRGISFRNIGRWKIEFWFCPPNYQIAEHSHPNEDIELLFLFGHNIRFHRREQGKLLGESFFARFKHIGTVFTIKAGTYHWFEVSSWPLIFMNIEKWYSKPTSASEDFQLAVEQKEFNYATKES